MSDRADEIRSTANEIRRACLDHAAELIASADAVMRANGAQHIAYHLGILALEEIGKAGMVGARAASIGFRDIGWLDKKFDDHEWKMMWAVWSPSMGGGKIDPKDFEEARRFAQSTHARRLRGLYVDADATDLTAVSPKSAVLDGHATSLIELARARLELERTRGEADYSSTDELAWFLRTFNDERGKSRLFSRSFIDKYAELKGDARAWVGWAKGEFERIAEEEKAHLERELARAPAAPAESKPRWLVRVRIHTLSHSIRPRALNVWNDAIQWIKLRPAHERDQMLMELTLPDTVKLEELFNVALQYCSMVLVALNIGSIGMFWYEFPKQQDKFFESMNDIDAPHLIVDARKEGSFGGWKQREALDEERMRRVIECLALLAPIPNDDAEPIFSPYLHALVLMAKSDMHLSCENEARSSFGSTLRKASKHFGDWNGDEETLIASLKVVFSDVIADPAHLEEFLAPLTEDYKPAEGRFAEAIAIKTIADLYLAVVARRRWLEPGAKAPEDSRDASDPSTHRGPE